jgi:hypothetical protein
MAKPVLFQEAVGLCPHGVFGLFQCSNVFVPVWQSSLLPGEFEPSESAGEYKPRSRKKKASRLWRKAFSPVKSNPLG